MISSNYNENGEIKSFDFFSSIILLFIFLYLLFVVLSFYIIVPFSAYIDSFSILSNYYSKFVNEVIETYPTFLNFDKELINFNIILLYLITPFLVLYITTVSKFAKIQTKLSNIGLETYYVSWFWGNNYVFKPVKGNKMKIDKFIKHFKDVSQLFSQGSVKFERYGKNAVKVIFRHHTPTIEDLQKFNALDYLKDKNFFLGFKGGEKNKIEPVYISIKNILHTAFLGATGKGKSNTLNMFILSIFKNFNVFVNTFIFVDFKGGIEANTYLKLEEELETGKIEVYNNNRLRFYKLLKRLTVINLARQKYIVDNNIKKIDWDLIFLVIDEIAFILKFETDDKDLKLMQKEMVLMIETLFFIARSQGILITISTQSFVGNASGLTGIMKLNIETKVQHYVEEETAIKASFPEPQKLYENSINPADFSKGEFVFKSENTDYISSRALYIEEDVIKLKNIFKQILLTNLPSKQKTVDVSKYYEDIINNEMEESQFYSKEELLNDLSKK